jgi:hypothetical protein
VKTDSFKVAARDALLPFLSDRPATETAPSAAPGAAAAFAADEVVALTRCVMAWQPMGAPASATPQSPCVSAAREMAPTWGEREKARLALKRTAT